MKNLVRFAVVLSTVAMTAACAGTAPTSPSAGLTASASAAASTDAKGGSLTGSAALNFADLGGGVVGFADAVQDGQTGRVVVLSGDIVGTNFEAGVCHPGTLDIPGIGTTHCFAFGDGPGMFTRSAPGGVAFTTCKCSVGGVGSEATTQVTLKISYPPAVNGQYPAGFTKFTFQHGTGALSTLSGQGTLNFAVYPQASFAYRFNRS